MCVWRGKWADYKTHKCPLEVKDVSDVGVLQDLMNCDERMFIRLKILGNMGERVMNSRNADINEDYLSMIYGYMKRFQIYVEIQSMCLDILIHVGKNKDGLMHILHACAGIKQYLEECISKNVVIGSAETLLKAFRALRIPTADETSEALLKLHTCPGIGT